jgi:hypothetical protein
LWGRGPLQPTPDLDLARSEDVPLHGLAGASAVSRGERLRDRLVLVDETWQILRRDHGVCPVVEHMPVKVSRHRAHRRIVHEASDRIMEIAIDP